VSVNVENMRKWVDRLRDPQAKQAVNQLRDADGAMCCLGHACDVSGLAEWKDGFYLESHKMLPKDVQKWLGVFDHNPVVDGWDLSEWNDFLGNSLPEIANLIEAKWPGVKR
jgi:hypothetical protein